MPLSASYYYPTVHSNVNYPITPPLQMSASSTFLGNAFSVVFGPVDISKYKNWKVYLFNNSVNNLKSGSVELSPDGSTWEVIHSSSFTPLTSSGFASYMMTGSVNPFLRIRAWPSGSAGGLSGSVNVILNA